MPIPTAAAPDQVTVSHCLLDAHGEVLSAHDEDRPFYAASTIKLHVLLAVLQTVEHDAVDLGQATAPDRTTTGVDRASGLDRTVPATRTFTGFDGAPFTLAGDHLDPTHPADGRPVTIRDLLQRMIDRSSNEATNQLIELVGPEAVAGAIAGLGLRRTRVERLIGDASALAAGLTNETSAADLDRTMLALVQHGSGAVAEAGSIDLARTALRAQRIPVIATALREGVDRGSKSGWVDGYRHDVAFLGDPDSPQLRVLAVMTAGMAPGEADARITALARDLLPDLAA